MSKTKFVVAIAIIAALALLSAFGGAWKWRHATGSQASAQERIAGWTWDDTTATAES
jgi:hypothetical protein